jgi:hypothetical protein
VSGEIVPLFHPRRGRWLDHFTVHGARIEGITSTRRATVHVLAMNDARRIELRTEISVRGEPG